MLITRLKIKSATIVKRATLDTDTLDPEYLEFACETVARAEASLEPLAIMQHEGHTIYLGMGFPDEVRGIRADATAQQLLGQIFAEMPEAEGYLFNLRYQGTGPVYVVLPDGQEEQKNETWGAAQSSETRVDALLDELKDAQSGDLHERLSNFESMWDEVLESLPVVLQFGRTDWGQNWDDYAMYIATAILLED